MKEHKVRPIEVITLFVVWALILVLASLILAPSTALAVTLGDAWSADLPWPGGPSFHDAADCSWWHFFQGNHWYDPNWGYWDMYWWLR